MAGLGLLRQLVWAARSSGTTAGQVVARSLPAVGCSDACSQSASRAYASDASGAFSRKEVIYNMDNQDDPEAQAGIRAFLRQQFQQAAKGGATPAASTAADADLELTGKVERKYLRAQVVECGIQNISAPVAYDKEGDAALKRYVAQLNAVGKEAGFDEAAVEVEKKLQEAAQGMESAKELLQRLRPYASPDFHASLMEALAEVEAQTGAGVALDGASDGFKKFADKVKALAQQHKLPWQMLLSHKQRYATADEDARDALRRDYAAWVQSAQLSDARGEMDALRGEATRLLDTQLSKTAEAVRKEQEAAMQAMHRRLEAAKREGAPWAAKLQEDLRFVEWFDAAVAANPAEGPRASATA